MNSNKFRLVRIDDPEDRKLLDFYNNVLKCMFTNKDDLDSLEEIQGFLRLYNYESRESPSYEVIILLRNECVIGGSVFGVFKTDDYCFIKGEYTGISKANRKDGAFDYLLRERVTLVEKLYGKKKCGKIDFIINELTSSDKACNDRDGFLKTVKLWKMRGYKKIDFNFVQLPLNDDKEAIAYFDLYILPLTEKYRSVNFISKHDMKNIVNACQTFRNSDKKVDSYLEYQNMIKLIDQKGKIEICIK